jgi:hypothetical protein
VIRTLIDSRPPALSWASAAPPLGGAGLGWQPSLLDEEVAPAATPRPGGGRYLLMDGCGTVAPAAGLPDPAQWSAVLALAITQVLTGIRPVSQLDRWLGDHVLADVRCAVRQRQRQRAEQQATAGGPVRKAPRISVASVRAQCPTPTAVEAAAHVRIGSRSAALAFRLEAFGGRWLTTALEMGELGPR